MQRLKFCLDWEYVITSIHPPLCYAIEINFSSNDKIEQPFLTAYPGRPVINLTRSGYLGSQKYDVIIWSGDISATWQVLKNQVVAANQISLSGLPYWTLDIGGFFVKKGIQWYWNGDYDDTTQNAGYRELYARCLLSSTTKPAKTFPLSLCSVQNI